MEIHNHSKCKSFARLCLHLGVLSLMCTLPVVTAGATERIEKKLNPGQETAGQTQTNKGKVILRGRIVEKNNPKAGIPFATIYLPQIGGGTMSKADGSFEIKNLSPEIYRIEISSLGFKSFQTTVDMKKGKNVFQIYSMEKANFRLNEVLVTATNSKAGATTASKISRMAIDHIQATSLADVMQLLPGATVDKPDLVGVSTLELRGGSSLGTAIIMDGAPLSNNSNMQLMSTAIGGALPATGAVSPRRGIDLRTITTDNIESVEVLTGVPGVEYGDLTAGAVIVNTKAGRQPLQVKFNTNPNVYMFSGIKGFGLGDKGGSLNVGMDYAYSNANPTEGYDYYQRITARMMYSNVFFRDRLRTNTSLNIVYGKDKGEPNPDDDQDEEISNQKDLGLIFNTNGTLDVGAGWFKNIKYVASLNYTKRHSYYTDVAVNADNAYSQATIDSSVMSNVPGRVVYDKDGNPVTWVPEGEENLKAWRLPGTYTYEYDLYGKELNTFAKITANFAGKTGNIHHRMLVGADFRNSGNLGRGKVFDPELPPWRNINWTFATQRDRAFKDIPFMNHLGVYAEENIEWLFGKHVFNLSAGIRWDKVCGFGDGFSPRINASVDIIPEHLALRGAYGITMKAPTLSFIHPDKAYFDMLNFDNSSTSAPDEQKFQVITTRVFDTKNPDLEMAKNKKFELGLDVEIQKMHFFITAYQEKCDNGYSMDRSVNTFKKVDYIQYQEVKPRPEDGKTISTLEEKARNPYLLEYSIPMNSLQYLVRGIDFDFDFESA